MAKQKQAKKSNNRFGVNDIISITLTALLIICIPLAIGGIKIFDIYSYKEITNIATVDVGPITMHGPWFFRAAEWLGGISFFLLAVIAVIQIIAIVFSIFLQKNKFVRMFLVINNFLLGVLLITSVLFVLLFVGGFAAKYEMLDWKWIINLLLAVIPTLLLGGINTTMLVKARRAA
ncbi:hypothetical protein [[Acholeplasma] multilocale]|uniref:hypothetical protein n=1 Tax=[Acholeplasma] multilocale TaxID=264638 RepID=UPI00047E001A|nr:hypothetical protein [[Acholeplasma] multilocale]